MKKQSFGQCISCGKETDQQYADGDFFCSDLCNSVIQETLSRNDIILACYRKNTIACEVESDVCHEDNCGKEVDQEKELSLCRVMLAGDSVYVTTTTENPALSITLKKRFRDKASALEHYQSRTEKGIWLWRKSAERSLEEVLDDAEFMQIKIKKL